MEKRDISLTNVFGVHGDEGGVSEAGRSVYFGKRFNNIYNSHPEAGDYRVTSIPLGTPHIYYSDLEVLRGEAHLIPDLAYEDYGYVDLNRQYFLWDEKVKEKNFSELQRMDKDELLPIIIDAIGYKPAQDLLRTIMEKSKEMEMFVTWHEDYKVPGSETYAYYVVGKSSTKESDQFYGQFEKFTTQLRENGFTPFDGTDSSGDPMLGRKAENGLIVQSVVDRYDKIDLDGNLEGMIGLLRELGFFPRLKHIFCIEFPGLIPFSEKQRLMGLYKNLLDSLT